VRELKYRDKHCDVARLDSRANVDEVSLKSNMASLAPFVNSDSGKLNFISRPRRFYIDDILGSDFGDRRPVESKSYYLTENCESDENQWSVTDTAATNPRDHPNIVNSAIQLNNGTASELDKSTCRLARPSTVSFTTLQPPSSSVTSSRCYHNSGISADTSSNSMGRRTALKDDVMMERCNSTRTEVTANNDTRSSISDVTSSTASHPEVNREAGRKTNSKDSFTLPAWVYCTRYSDRPSAGNVQTLYITCIKK